MKASAGGTQSRKQKTFVLSPAAAAAALCARAANPSHGYALNASNHPEYVNNPVSRRGAGLPARPVARAPQPA
jgi:hypothetical protein